MHRHSCAIALALVLLAAGAQAEPPARVPPLEAGGRDAIHGAATLWVVTTPSWDAATGQLTVWRRVEGAWTEGQTLPATVGHAGLRWGRGLTSPLPGGPTKVEGDGATPAGLFRVAQAVGEAAASPGGGLPYRRALPTTRCVDDPSSLHYNRILEAPPGGEPWRSAEHMVRADGLYRVLAVVDHNGGGGGEAVPHGGSCIFVHAWSGPGAPTVGCVALAPPALERLLGGAAPVLLAIVPAPLLPEARRAWGLPPGL